MDEIRLESYSKALIEEFPEDSDTFLALEKLAVTPREEFDPIIPAKIELIRLVKTVGWSRKRAAREAAEAEAERVYAETVKAEREAGLHEHLNLDSAIEKALANKAVKEAEAKTARAYAPTVVQECAHCGPVSPTSSEECFRLARYYQARGERALDRETAAPEKEAKP